MLFVKAKSHKYYKKIKLKGIDFNGKIKYILIKRRVVWINN